MDIMRLNGENVFAGMCMELDLWPFSLIETSNDQKKSTQKNLSTVFERAFPNTNHSIEKASHEFSPQQGTMAVPACVGGE